MNNLRKLFHHKPTPAEAQPLAIEGIKEAPITFEPDDAELAAQALLELLASKKGKVKSEKSSAVVSSPTEDERGATYYHALADRIREAHRMSALRATRFVAACEYMLEDKHLPYYGDGSLSLLEAELYKRIDIIERAGGELKRRWQHCLAEVTVRLMEAAENEAPYNPPGGG